MSRGSVRGYRPGYGPRPAQVVDAGHLAGGQPDDLLHHPVGDGGLAQVGLQRTRAGGRQVTGLRSLEDGVVGLDTGILLR